MSLFLQTPALLGLLALAALPAIVHLISRARPPEYRFSNTEFLKRVIRRTARFRRPKDWLLLLLRTLALLALAAAFVSPLLVSKNIALPGEATTAVILIDRSASMAAPEGVGSRFDAACTEAAAFLQSAKPTAANLIWIDAGPAAVFPEPGPNTSYLEDQLKTTEPHHEEGALAAAIDIALRQLAPAKGRRQLVIISDFQATAWRDFSPSIPGEIETITRSVATTAPANIAITRVLAQPAAPVSGQETTVLANIKNFSPDPRRTQLTLDAGGSRQSRDIELPPWGEVESAFTLRPATAGPLPVTASIDSDTFPADDTRHTVIPVRDAIRIAMPAGQERSPATAVLTKVIQSLPWLEPTPSPAPGDIAVNPPAGEIITLATAGITVIIEAPQPAAIAALTNVTTTTATHPGEGWRVLPREDHPAIRLFRTGDFGNPFAGTFRQRLDLPATLASEDDIHPIATYDDGVPAILEIRTPSAPVILLNLSLDPAHTDWPTQGTFLPAFAEILLRTRPAGRTESTHATPGSRLHLTSTRIEEGSAALTLVGPNGNPWPITQSPSTQGTRWQSEQPATPGLFRWHISGQPVAISAVNFPESQSDLRPLDAAPTFDGTAITTTSFARQAALARGIPLWPWLVLTAIAALLAESLIHLQSSQKSKI